MNEQNDADLKARQKARLLTAGFFSIIVLFFVIILYNGHQKDKAREAKRQARIEVLKKFTELNVERNAPYKISIDIILRNEVTESELKEIAYLLYNDKAGSNYQRMFINCYAWDQTTSDIPWATANFNPNLKVKFNSY